MRRPSVAPGGNASCNHKDQPTVIPQKTSYRRVDGMITSYPPEIMLDTALKVFHWSMAVLPSLYFAWHGVKHEIGWRRRLGTYKIISGVIVGSDIIDDYPHAIIEYVICATKHRFTATYTFAEPAIGVPTQVAYNEQTGVADQYSLVGRWFFTIYPIAFAIFWFVVGLGMRRG